MIAARRINLQTQVTHALRHFIAQNLATRVHVDVEVVSGIALGRGSKNWLRQLRGELQSRRQFFAANALRFLIFLPARAGQIPTDDAFHRQRLCLAYDHRPTGQLIAKCV